MSDAASTTLLNNSEKEEAQSRATMTLHEFAVATGILLCSRLAGSTRQSLWFDEGYTLALANSTSFRHFLHVFSGFTTSEHLQPVYYVCMFLWSRLAGTSDFALRFPSAAFSVLSGVLVFSVARYMSAPARTAARWFPPAALGAYCLSSFSCYYAQEARPYALVQLVSLAVVYLWLRNHGSEDNASKGLKYFLLACVAAVLTSPFGALVVFSLSFADLLFDTTHWSRRWKRPILAATFAFVLYFIAARWLMPSFVSHDTVAIRQPVWMNAAYALFGLFFGTTLGPPSSMLHQLDKLELIAADWKIALAAFCSLVALTIATLRILHDREESTAWMRVLAFATIINGIGLFLIFGVIGQLNVLPRHASGLFAMLFILCTACGSRLGDPLQKASVLFIAGLIGVLALNAVSLWQYCTNPSYRKDDYRAMANMIRAQSYFPNTRVFVIEGDPELFRHYGVSLIDASQIDPGSLLQFIRRRAQNEKSFELVVNQYRNYRWNSTASPAQVLKPSYQCTILQTLSYMQLVRCSPSSSASEQAEVAKVYSAGGRSLAH